MPNKPISIEFTAETDKYERGLKDAERATKKFGDEIEDLPDSSAKAARGIKADMDKVEAEMADAGKESAQEFKQNLGESLSSGDLTTIIQDTAGGLVSGLSGPLAAAAAVLAGGAALAFGQMQKQAEQAAALSNSFLEQMRDNLGKTKDEMDAAFKQEQFADWVKENLKLFQDVNDELHDAGVSADDYAEALFEGGDKLEHQKEMLRQIMATHGELVGPIGRQHVEYDAMGDAAAELLTTIGNMEGAHKEATDEARVYAETVNQSARKAVQDLILDIERIPKSIPFTVTVDKSSIKKLSTEGGAFVTSGGSRVTAVYGNRPGEAG